MADQCTCRGDDSLFSGPAGGRDRLAAALAEGRAGGIGCGWLAAAG